jgi:hypothetical protein
MDGTACNGDEVCASGVCTAPCVIDGTVVQPGAANPTNPCETCQPEASTSAWTNVTGAGNCPPGQVCDDGACSDGCYVEGSFFADGATANDGCEVCTPSTTTTAWSDVSGSANCPMGELCSAGSCQPTCEIDNNVYAAGTTANSGCEVCVPATHEFEWVNAADGTSCGADDAECVEGTCTGVAEYSAPGNPEAMVFDGTNIWVATLLDNGTVEFDAATGTTSRLYAFGGFALAFDGANVWATDADDTVTKVLASTGATVGVYTVGHSPVSIVFDGTNIWVANGGDSSVTKLLAATGATLGTYSAGGTPSTLAFDGADIWVTMANGTTVKKIAPSTGAVTATYTTGNSPEGMAFDGVHMWVANFDDGTVTKLLASSGATLGTYAVSAQPFALAFDGSNIWVADFASPVVTKLLAATGATVSTYALGAPAAGILFADHYVWVSDDNGVVNKFPDF